MRHRLVEAMRRPFFLLHCGRLRLRTFISAFKRRFALPSSSAHPFPPPRLGEVLATPAIEAAGLGLWEWEVEADQVIVSPTLADLLGRPELAGRQFSSQVLTDLTHPDDQQMVSEALENAVSSADGQFCVEHRIVHSSGAERWLWIRASIVQRSPAGEAQKIVGVVQDCTDKKQTEMALEREKRRYDLAVSGSEMAIWEWDASTERTSWSPRACEMLGMDTSISSGDRTLLIDRIHPDDLERVRAALFDHVDNRTPFDTELRLRHNDGHYITVRARGRAEFDDAGRPLRMAGSTVDITKEREAEAAARRAGLRAQLSIAAAELGTWEFDAAGGTAVMDHRLSALLGRPELAGLPLDRDAMFEFSAPEDIDRVRADFAALNNGDVDVIHNEHRVLHADGRRIWILAHVGVAERGADGRPARLVGVTQDLSVHKATEAALRNAKERAEAASAAKSSFLATMSHEIRTPLNGMLGVAQLLGLSQLDEKQRRYVDTLQASGRVLTGLIEEILDISRIEAGKLHLSPEVVSTADWLEETLNPFLATAAQKGLTLSWETEAEAGCARLFDPRRMAQVVGNLVSNAVKFTDAGAITVTVAAPNADRLRFQVTDTGPGISADQQAAIFERFTQADMSPSREHGGSGLGLAIARELTKLAGGDIGVLSKLGEGASFWFEIPAARAAATSSSEATETAKPSLEGLRALIVEDNAINRDTLVEMLHQHAVTTEAVDCGEAALERLADRSFDVVLLDLHMPGIGGYQTLQKIRAGGAGRSDIPVYLVTADATPAARDWANTLGADGFFSKPVEMTSLISTLASMARAKDGG